MTIAPAVSPARIRAMVREGLTGKDIAARLNISGKTLARWCAGWGIVLPTRSDAQRIAHARRAARAAPETEGARP